MVINNVAIIIADDIILIRKNRVSVIGYMCLIPTPLSYRILYYRPPNVIVVKQICNLQGRLKHTMGPGQKKRMGPIII